MYVKFALFLHCCSIAHLPPTCSVHTPHQLSFSSPWGVNRCWSCAGWSAGTWQHMLLLQPLLHTSFVLVLFSATKQNPICVLSLYLISKWWFGNRMKQFLCQNSTMYTSGCTELSSFKLSVTGNGFLHLKSLLRTSHHS